LFVAILIDIPQDLDASLRGEFDDLDRAVRESFLVNLFRIGKLSQGRLAELLGVSRVDADALLLHHGVDAGVTAAELAGDVQSIAKVRQP
jgi:predicted HTH domain antitoxin